MPEGSPATRQTTPNPGSPEAYAQGCICARMDNCNGRFAPRVGPNGEDQWWITSGCPVHSPEASP